MKSTTPLAAVLLSAATSVVAISRRFGQPDYSLFRRSVTTDASTISGVTYDYIIVGGGLAGLVVANRLSANPNISVVVIEAGESGYRDDAKFSVPAANLYNSSVGTKYDWQWKTVPQHALVGRSAAWPRGKVLGGSSAINGLYYVRHSELEQQAWAGLIGDTAEWGWTSMLDAMKKSESFTPPHQQTLAMFNVPYDQASHGTNGPLHVSYPSKMYPHVGAFLQSTNNVGISQSLNPDAGHSWGAFLATSNINPVNSTRSFSRTAYLDPVSYRTNLAVLTGHQVTNIVFNSTSGVEGVVASGVQFAPSSGANPQSVYAAKEVILCGGAVNDPQILQLSGIADTHLLQNLGIQTVVDLPGVGYHLQDHLSTGVVFTPSNPSTMPPTTITGNHTTDSYVNSAIAYVSGSTMFGQPEWSRIISQFASQRDASVAAYNAPAAVKLGYNATYSTQVDTLFPSQLGPIELLFALSFGGIQVQAALQHPLSRGSILINSTDAFESPLIDPAYLSNPADMAMLRQAFKLARNVGTTPPLANYTSAEVAPGAAVVSDADWEAWIRKTVGTEFHPSSTCSMLPREQGGVVDARLRVYGTKNVRVVDASVPPISFSAHLMSVVYGLAEIGSGLVLDDYVVSMNPPPTNTTSATNGTGSSSSTTTTTTTTTANAGNTASSSAVSFSLPYLAFTTSLMIAFCLAYLV